MNEQFRRLLKESMNPVQLQREDEGLLNPMSPSFCLLQEAARTERKSKSCGLVLRSTLAPAC